MPLRPRTVPSSSVSAEAFVARITSSRAVCLGGVDEVHTDVDGVRQRRYRLRLVARPIEGAHAHRAQADWRHPQPSPRGTGSSLDWLLFVMDRLFLAGHVCAIRSDLGVQCREVLLRPLQLRDDALSMHL